MIRFVFKIAVAVLLLGIVAFAALFIVLFVGEMAKQSASATPQLPPAQSAFLHLLEDYRKQYSGASSLFSGSRNDIQMNRIYDARKKALCDVDADVRDWTGVVVNVRTSLFNSRHKASLDIALPSSINDNVGFRGVTINSKEDPELFETFAKLKRGDKIRFSGRLNDYKGCVQEHSVTQAGGMEWPAFRFTYSEVNGVRSTKLSAKDAL